MFHLTIDSLKFSKDWIKAHKVVPKFLQLLKINDTCLPACEGEGAGRGGGESDEGWGRVGIVNRRVTR